ncbi:hypothetical protein H6F67_19270 [Microcoleus sp. FACHB-1515]|uniref:hypothetical protein n=1 Tax=Cyanophyceae TaxID=3028117 RepID=UPI0016820CBA|nr:hypothetical protein [Microcoleus sp. FACHB-1515]MBD2091991.1 hypothetical protein [Microcoleus sp. FACHB-1515]
MTQGFHDELSLADRAVALGEQAMKQGIIPSFVVRHYPDSRQFLIPDDSAEPLTPEEAFLKFKKMLGEI